MSSADFATTSTHVTFARALASPDKTTRDKTLKTLKKYLASIQEMTDMEMLKLWKALYYCMWLADKVQIQTELASSLSCDLFRAFTSKPIAYLYMRMFFRTMMREWSLIDQHRINKYYILIRFVLREILTHICDHQYNQLIVDQTLNILYDEVLRKTPNGPRMHIADIFLEELWVVTNGNIDTKSFLMVMSPFFKAIQTTPDGIFQQRVSNKIFSTLATSYSKENLRKVQNLLSKTNNSNNGNNDNSEEMEEVTEEPIKVFIQVSPIVIQKRIFDLAGDTDTIEQNRRKLYTLHADYPLVTGKSFISDEDHEIALNSKASTQEMNGGQHKTKKMKDHANIENVSEVNRNSNHTDNKMVDKKRKLATTVDKVTEKSQQNQIEEEKEVKKVKVMEKSKTEDLMVSKSIKSTKNSGNLENLKNVVEASATGLATSVKTVESGRMGEKKKISTNSSPNIVEGKKTKQDKKTIMNDAGGNASTPKSGSKAPLDVAVEQTPALFIKSLKFTGSKPGYAFKKVTSKHPYLIHI